MALQKPISLSSGLSAPEAYWRIERFSGSRNGISIHLTAYKSLADYQQGRAAISSAYFPMPFNAAATDNILRQGYVFIKTQPDWSSAVDA